MTTNIKQINDKTMLTEKNKATNKTSTRTKERLQTLEVH